MVDGVPDQCRSEPAGAGRSEGTELVHLIGPSPGRDAEFADFMRSAAPALARTAWLLCGDAHQADELVQQALVRTYLAWPRARDRDPLAYARRVLANQRISTWRRLRREQLVSPSDVPDSVDRRAEHAYADRVQLVRALALLTPRQRRVVVLRHFEDLSEQDVAADLGISVGTVKSTASRALARLRAEITDETASAAAPGRRGADDE